MPSAGSEDEDEEPVEAPSPRPRRSRRKVVRMGLVGVVIVAAILIGYIGSAPKPDLTPSYVMDRAESLLDHEVRVRGMVSGWDTDNDTFFLVDDQGNLSVKYSVPPPHQMEVGKEAVVIGIVKQSGGAYYVQVEEIIVGHPG